MSYSFKKHILVRKHVMYGDPNGGDTLNLHTEYLTSRGVAILFQPKLEI